jgi:hypothetical protein
MHERVQLDPATAKHGMLVAESSVVLTRTLAS